MIYTLRIGTCGVYACRIHWHKLAHANNDSDDKTAYQKRRYFLRTNQRAIVMLFFFSFLILLALPRGKRLFGNFVTVKWPADTVRSMEHERLIKGCLCPGRLIISVNGLYSMLSRYLLIFPDFRCLLFIIFYRFGWWRDRLFFLVRGAHYSSSARYLWINVER